MPFAQRSVVKSDSQGKAEVTPTSRHLRKMHWINRLAQGQLHLRWGKRALATYLVLRAGEPVRGKDRVKSKDHACCQEPVRLNVPQNAEETVPNEETPQKLAAEAEHEEKGTRERDTERDT